MNDHTHHQWRSTIANVAEEAIAEELSSYKELFTTVVDHGAAATYILFSCLLQLPILLQMNSCANATILIIFGNKNQSKKAV